MLGTARWQLQAIGVTRSVLVSIEGNNYFCEIDVLIEYLKSIFCSRNMLLIQNDFSLMETKNAHTVNIIRIIPLILIVFKV